MARGQSAGAVRIDILAYTAKFTKAMRTTQTRLRRFRNQVRRMYRQMSGYAKTFAVGITLASTALTAAIAKSAQYSSTLVETARATGQTTRQLENLRRLFEGDGLSIQQTDKALKDFAVRLGQAQRGMSTYKRAYEELGVEIRNADGSLRRNNEVFNDVANALGRMDDQTRASAIAYDLLGRAGRDLVPVFQQNNGVFEAAAKHAGRFNTVTDDMREKGKALWQAITELKNNVWDFAERVLVQYSDRLTTAINKFNLWLSGLKGSKVPLEDTANAILEVGQNIGRASSAVAGSVIGGALGAGTSALVAAATGGMVGSAAGGPIGLALGAVVGLMLYNRTTSSVAKFLEDTELDLVHEVTKDTATGRYIADLEAKKDEILRKDHPTQADADRYNELTQMLVPYMADRSIWGRNFLDTAAMQSPLRNLHLADSQRIIPKDTVAEYFEEVRKNTSKYRGVSENMLAFLHGLDDWVEQTPLAQAQTFNQGLDPQMMFGDRIVFPSRPARPIANQLDFIDRQRIGGVNINLAEIMAYASEGNRRRAVNMIQQRNNEMRRRMRIAGAVPPFTTVGTPTVGAPAYDLGPRSFGPGVSAEIMQKYGPIVATNVLPGMVEWASKVLKQRLMTAPNTLTGGAESDEFLARYADTTITPAMIEWSANLLEKRLRTAPNTLTTGIESERFLRQFEPTRITGAMQDWALRQLPQNQGRIYGDVDWQQMTSVQAEKMKKELEKTRYQTNELRGAFNSLGDSIVDNFTNAGEALRQFARELVKIGLRRTILNPIGNALFGAEDGSSDGLFGGVFNDIFPDMSGAAASTIDFSRPGALGSGMAASSITIVNNIASTDGPGVRAALAQATPGIIASAEAKISDNATRYGTTRRMIRGTA